MADTHLGMVDRDNRSIEIESGEGWRDESQRESESKRDGSE